MFGAVAWGLWVVLLVAGALWAEHRDPAGASVGVVAARAMPEGTLLLPGPFMPDGWTGRYVVAPGGVVAGHVLTRDDLGTRPTLLPPATGMVLASVAVAPGAVEAGLNAGTAAALCRDDTRIVAAVTVRTVLCVVEGDARRCRAVLELPGRDRAILDELPAADLIVRAAHGC